MFLFVLSVTSCFELKYLVSAMRWQCCSLVVVSAQVSTRVPALRHVYLAAVVGDGET